VEYYIRQLVKYILDLKCIVMYPDRCATDIYPEDSLVRPQVSADGSLDKTTLREALDKFAEDNLQGCQRRICTILPTVKSEKRCISPIGQGLGN
jgi:hypothetical protein